VLLLLLVLLLVLLLLAILLVGAGVSPNEALVVLGVEREFTNIEMRGATLGEVVVVGVLEALVVVVEVVLLIGVLLAAALAGGAPEGLARVSRSKSVVADRGELGPWGTGGWESAFLLGKVGICVVLVFAAVLLGMLL
jgi:hypothetical protein